MKEPDVHLERLIVAGIAVTVAFSILMRLVGGPPITALVVGAIATVLVRRAHERRNGDG